VLRQLIVVNEFNNVLGVITPVSAFDNNECENGNTQLEYCYIINW